MFTIRYYEVLNIVSEYVKIQVKAKKMFISNQHINYDIKKAVENTQNVLFRDSHAEVASLTSAAQLILEIFTVLTPIFTCC